MAQNVTVAGASYSDVPSVTLPKTGGGTAAFTDVTDTTAEAGDVAAGEYFYTAAGVRTLGTASGGGTPQWKTTQAYTTNASGIAFSVTSAPTAFVLFKLPTNTTNTAGIEALLWDGSGYFVSGWHGSSDARYCYAEDGTSWIQSAIQFGQFVIQTASTSGKPWAFVPRATYRLYYL